MATVMTETTTAKVRDWYVPVFWIPGIVAFASEDIFSVPIGN